MPAERVAASQDPVPDRRAPVDLDRVLAEYRRRRRLEHLVGPAASLLFHLAVVAAAFLYRPPPPRETAPVEVTIQELEVKELDPRQLEELQTLEDLADALVPTVEKPEVRPETADVEALADLSDDVARTDDALDFSSVLDVRATDTPLKLPGLYGGRSEAGRREMSRKYGGTPRAEEAVLNALRWLKRTQNADGSWSRTEPDAMAGLGLLTFLAHGETPAGKEFGQTVQKALQYLADRMLALEPGNMACLGREYTHAIATYALSEAYGVTKLPLLKAPMEAGLKIIVEGQQARGGFDYGYAKGARWDLSVSGWQFQALKAGYVAGAGVRGLVDAMEKGVRFIRDTTYRDGRFGYSSPGEGSMGIQGVGVLCLQLLGEGDCREARTVADYIHKTEKVLWDETRTYETHTTPVYTWYYATQAMFHAGRGKWTDWNKRFADTVIDHQKADGHWESPGKPPAGREKAEYDPWYATTLLCLSLQVYYRYLPTYKVPEAMSREKPSVLEAVDRDLGLDRQ